MDCSVSSRVIVEPFPMNFITLASAYILANSSESSITILRRIRRSVSRIIFMQPLRLNIVQLWLVVLEFHILFLLKAQGEIPVLHAYLLPLPAQFRQLLHSPQRQANKRKILSMFFR